MSSPIWDAKPATQIVIAVFEAAIADSGVALFTAMEEATGLTRDELRGAIGTARRRLKRTHKVRFRSERDVGYRVMADAEFATLGERAVGKISRIQNRTRKDMELVDLTKLTPDERRRHFGAQLRLQLVAKAASLATANKVEDAVKGTHNMSVDEQKKYVALVGTALVKKV